MPAPSLRGGLGPHKSHIRKPESPQSKVGFTYEKTLNLILVFVTTNSFPKYSSNTWSVWSTD